MSPNPGSEKVERELSHPITLPANSLSRKNGNILGFREKFAVVPKKGRIGPKLLTMQMFKASSHWATRNQNCFIQLAKRTQTIMFLREPLYRLFELSLNYQLDETQVRNLYEKENRP